MASRTGAAAKLCRRLFFFLGLFFSLFLGAAARFGLRVAATWVAMTALLGATLVLTATTDVSGLPALPAICIGFLLPNADLLWRQLKRPTLRS